MAITPARGPPRTIHAKTNQEHPIPIAIPASTPDNRLTPAQEALASLPAELKGTITPLSEDVLDLFAKIQQKEESLSDSPSQPRTQKQAKC